MRRKTLCLDFDGVVHSYTSPWVDALTIPDPPVPGAIDWLVRADRYFLVAIFSSRSKVPGGIEAMQRWLIRHMREGHPPGVNSERFVLETLRWPDNKPAASLYIDDRGLRFDGDWSSPELEPERLLEFRTWSGR